METTDQKKWEEDRGRFLLWGDGYAVLEGELDELFFSAGSRYLRVSAVIPLWSIAKTLCACLSGVSGLVSKTTDQGLLNFNNPATKPNAKLHTLFEAVLSLMPEAGDIIEPDWDDDDSTSEFDLSDATENIKDSVDLLFDIAPFIDDLYFATGPEDTTTGQGALTVESTNNPPCFEAQSYQRNILDKFPHIDKQLAETLAEINWARHQRIREWAKSHETQEVKTVKTNFADSGLRNSIFTLNPLLNPTRGNPFNSDASVTSFGTSNSRMGGDVRIPEMPTPSSTRIIKCCVCFESLSGVNTKRL